MKTAYDWIAVILFAALVTRFLQQSANRESGGIGLRSYFLATAGCALADWLGNSGWDLPAILLLTVVTAYVARLFVQPGAPSDDH